MSETDWEEWTRWPLNQASLVIKLYFADTSRHAIKLKYRLKLENIVLPKSDKISSTSSRSYGYCSANAPLTQFAARCCD